jgi:hypothetical protein
MVAEVEPHVQVPPLPFLLPWLRLELLICSITSTTWDDQTWPIVRIELARALRMRAAR